MKDPPRSTRHRQRNPSHMMTQRTDELSDEQLMSRLGGPEVEMAISKLYDRYSRTVFGVGLKILGDRSLAEELAQEVFLKVWRSSGTFDPYVIESPSGRCARRATRCVLKSSCVRTAKPSRLFALIKRGRFRTTSPYGFVQASLASGGNTLWT